MILPASFPLSGPVGEGELDAEDDEHGAGRGVEGADGLRPAREGGKCRGDVHEAGLSPGLVGYSRGERSMKRAISGTIAASNGKAGS